jgi:DNA-binding NarL/FixJ family response regulator
MPENRASALIAARPGPLQDGLQALMTAIPQIEIVARADDASAVVRLVTEYRPSLVLLDTSLVGNEAWTMLRQIKAEWPQARCTVLADNVQQQQEATAAGADAVLLKGFPAARLVATIEKLLSP